MEHAIAVDNGMPLRRWMRGAMVVLGLVCGCDIARAQVPLVIYTDFITNSFQDWSWATHNVGNTTPVHSGGKSIRVNANAWEALSFFHSDYASTPYASFTFWAHGGTTGGQKLQVYAQIGGVTNGVTYVLPSALTANTWQQFTIPLSALGIAVEPNVTHLNIQVRNDGTTNTFYLDDLQYDPKPVPALVNVSVNTTQAVQTVDARHFGVNLGNWDSNFSPPNNATTTALLKEMGCLTVRLPGGSLSDQYHWGPNTFLNGSHAVTAFKDFLSVTTNAGVQAIITVNYGSGTAAEAASWVRHANITNHLGYKYWEIGNECYGGWEVDNNSNPHDGFTYATRAATYIAQMRAADPTIKVGVVGITGEYSYINGYMSHPIVNPRTGQTNYGWTPVMLNTLKNLGATPDFLIYHYYPEQTDATNLPASSDDDTTLLQWAGNWKPLAADLRQQITDYFGAGGSNIELMATENNADSGAQGRQSSSLVDGLYYADSLAQILTTEFRSFCWWDLRNGSDTSGSFASKLYGWRTFGDFGMINGLSTRMPTFYAAKLMSTFVRPGDAVLPVTSDYAWLAAYAARHTNGSVSLLVLNKFNVTNLNAQITLNGYTPGTVATTRSYGVANDDAVRTNAPFAAQDITTNRITNAAASFSYTFPKLSMTVFTLVPSMPDVAVTPSPPPGKFVLQLQGQPGVPYVIQTSSNLTNWVSISTNLMVGSSMSVTGAVTQAETQGYWRGVWLP